MKRIICMAVCLALIATMAISGSVAYLYDQDDAINVFAVGNVDIVQYEEERTDSTESGLDDFTQGLMKYPMVESGEEKNPTEDIHGNNVTLRDLSHYRNYVDKIVSVENKGDSEAFVRNIVAIPTGLDAGAEDVDWLEVDWFNFPGETSTEWELVEPITKDVEIDRVLYDLYVFNYSNSDDGGKLQPADFTAPTLLGFGLSQNVGYDDVQGRYYYEEEFNSSDRTYININPQEMKIYVATQAVQTHGFDDFEHAFDETFGEVSASNHPWYEPDDTNDAEDGLSIANGQRFTWDELVTAQLVTVTGSTLTKVHADVEKLVIPDSITAVDSIAAQNNTNLKVIVFPSSPITIGKWAFSNTGIEGITIPGNVKLADETTDNLNTYCDQFNGCKKLKTVVIEDGVKAISNCCFKDCSALTSVTIPSSVIAIYTSAFRDCSSLESIELPVHLKDIIDVTKVFRGTTPAQSNITYY